MIPVDLNQESVRVRGKSARLYLIKKILPRREGVLFQNFMMRKIGKMLENLFVIFPAEKKLILLSPK